MSDASNGTGNRTTSNKVQMFVSATIVAAALLRLPSQDSGALLWVNILSLVLGTAGFLVAAITPTIFDRKP